ncbi:MAG: PAS domain-containing protein [Opitutaceae bacterium]
MNADSNLNPDAAEPAIPLPDRTLITAFLENVPDIIYFKDRHSRFIAVSRSKAQRHGLEPDELIGRTDADFFSEQHAQRARADEENILATGAAVLNQLERTQFLDGREGWTEVTKLPLCGENGDVIGTFGLSRDVTEAHEIKIEIEKAQRNVIEASRIAGMAEVATGVLHNVGNVLTSLNVSANVISSSLHQSKAASLGKLASLLLEHEANLGDFLAHDPKGRRVPEFIESLARHWLEERDRLTREIASLQENIDHIKDIVTMQQAHATMVSVIEPLDPAALMEAALRMNSGALARHRVSCVREFKPVPRVLGAKSKVLQILVNLIRNAKYATDEGSAGKKVITLRVEPGRAGCVNLVVEDSGIGIPPGNLDKIFNHGFTTRSNGHGFGLHSSLNAAQEMKGHLTVHSDGLGNGATFTLELPTVQDSFASSAAA